MQELQERRVRDHRALDALGEPAAEVALAQRAQALRVDEDGAGLPEGADQVLAEAAGGQREVDAGLAADGGVDHGQERGGHVDEGNPAQVGGGREAGGVAHDAAAQGHERARSLQAVLEHAAVERADDVERLGVLVGQKGDRRRLEAGRLQRLAGDPPVLALDPLVDRQERPAVGDDLGHARADAREQARLDDHLVAEVAGRDGDGAPPAHGVASARRRSSESASAASPGRLSSPAAPCGATGRRRGGRPRRA